jgi:hypothetical protein
MCPLKKQRTAGQVNRPVTQETLLLPKGGEQ